ncbi:MAG: hypothetical protein HY819_23775 [Acidobacteria bacterium]|nr:hypothetical protein [Acidobacteriota bacterium]
MYTNDGGTNWINKKLNTNLSLKSIEFFDNNTGYIAGIDTFFLSKDGGANWAKISVTGHNKRSIFSINFTSERKGWINTGTVILRTTNGGINWEIVETPQPGYTGGPVFVDDLHGWLTKSGGQHGSVVHAEEEENINSFGYVFSTSDGGVTWKETIHIESLKDHSAWILDMFLLDMMNGWVVGRDGLLMRTTDGGQTWQRSNNSLTKEK